MVKYASHTKLLVWAYFLVIYYLKVTKNVIIDRRSQIVKNKVVKGYKVFNNDWTCRGFQYKVGQIYEMADSPACCNRGFHFCVNASDCFQYYIFNPDTKVAEIEALGEIDTKDTKSCTNKIKIVREIPWNELLDIVNDGMNCTGCGNTGDMNSGDSNIGNRNTGDMNVGDWNTGDLNSGSKNVGDGNTGNANMGNWNIGNWNTGDRNIGSMNVGDNNIGDSNIGNWNTSDRNIGDWNKSSFNNGCFNTVEPTIMMFNKPSKWTYRDWMNSNVRYLLNGPIPKNLTEWVMSEDMTDEEKAAHPDYKTTGGYLRTLDDFECRQIWWDGLNDAQKNAVKSLPNFDPVIFKECTGISV